MCVCFVFFFCFQAEEGIRGLVRSRGLGDVYKRQGYVCRITLRGENGKDLLEKASIALAFLLKQGCVPVSYTHLTLPTSDLV